MTAQRERAPSGSTLIRERPTDDGDLGHIWCCQDDSIGLCGSPLFGEPTGLAPDCVVCVSIERDDPDWCPKGGPCVG